MDSQVCSVHVDFVFVVLTAFAEEFNKYLTYVRNLGFEDTPDYDYLRDLFTQALKATGEADDGEYDWMKLNNGKGWEAVKGHPSAAHLHHNNVPNSSARELHGAPGTNQRASKSALPPGRLEAELPKPGASRQPQAGRERHGQGRTRENAGAYTADPLQKRASDLRQPPEGSTAANFPHSNQNLAGVQTSRGREMLQQQQQTSRPAAPQDEKPKWYEKIFKVLCCGMCFSNL